MKKINTLVTLIAFSVLTSCNFPTFRLIEENPTRIPPGLIETSTQETVLESPTATSREVFPTNTQTDKILSALETIQAEPTKSPTLSPTKMPPGLKQWWDDAVFYEIFVRSFTDSDGNGVGDLNGLIEKLDYLNDGNPATDTDLGITGIWLMPIMESPSYHGYNVVDYYAVDREYGTNQDFQRLMEEAHKRGISVIVDLVINHTSSDHPWFIEAKNPNSPYRDWYIWSTTNPGYVGPWGEQVWHELGGEYFYGVISRGMPDLNLQNPEVTAEIYNIVRFWLEEMGVDGFRLDAIKHLVENGAEQENTDDTHAWLGDFYNFYKGVNPQAFTVGETWTYNAEVLDYTGDEVDIAFAFDLADAFMKSTQGSLQNAVTREMSELVETFPPGQYATFLTNHDQNRAMSQLLGNINKAKIAATLLLTSPGVPFIYYGEEIGMSGSKPDENIRLPMQWKGENIGAGMTTGTPWRAPAADYQKVNLALEINDPESLFNHYRSLIHLRNQHPALSTGGWTLVNSNNPGIYAFLRLNEEEVFLILVNPSKEVTTEEYSLVLKSGPLSESPQAVSLLGLQNPVSPEVNENGGFNSYTPFEILPAQSFAVLQLVP